MAEAHGELSVRQWLTHKRMLPKWLGLAITTTIAFAWLSPHIWWLVPLGVIIFFPIEYTVHRWVYHGFSSKPLGRYVSKQHINHHERPQDPDYLFNDPKFGAISAVVLFGIYYAISRDLGVAGGIAMGNYVGFVYYEWVHMTSHRVDVVPVTPWNRALKRYHLWHHFKHEHYWYGVTTSIFDRLFGSWKDQKEVPMSATVRTLVPPDAHVPWLEGRKSKSSAGDAQGPVAAEAGT